MTLYFSASKNAFYDTVIHGELTLKQVDPDWERSTKEVELAVGESITVDGQVYSNETDAPLCVTVPDMSAEPDMVEVANPDCKIPADAVAITSEQHQALLTGQANGQLIQANDDGVPILADPPEPTDEEKEEAKAAAVRSARDDLVDRTSREINRLEDAGTDASAWRSYRVALRNVPEQDGFPFDVTWPEQPADYTGK